MPACLLKTGTTGATKVCCTITKSASARVATTNIGKRCLGRMYFERTAAVVLNRGRHQNLTNRGTYPNLTCCRRELLSATSCVYLLTLTAFRCP